MSLLAVNGLQAGYGRKQVVFDATLEVDKGTISVLLGHNGAGKTPILRAIQGVLPVTGGEVLLDGAGPTNASPRAMVSSGVAFMPSERFVYDDLAVEDNLIAASLPLPRSQRREALSRAADLFPVLAERRKQRAGTLSGGQKRMLSTAMLLAVRPRLLLLDEPSLGLAPAVVDELFDVLRRLCDDEGLGILLVEQNVGQALRIGDEVFALRAGRVFLRESAAQLRTRTEFWDLF